MNRLAWTLGFAWLILLLCHSWYGPDIWYHMFWGRELIENGHWIPQTRVLFQQPIAANGYWLFQSIVYLAYNWGGLYAGSIFFGLMWVATAILWLRIGDLWRKPLGLWIFGAFIVCMQLRFEQRPEVLSYFFITFMTYLAWREKIWPLFIAQILWTGCHGYFVMGPFLAAAVLFHIKPDWRRALKVGTGLLFSTLINPFGYKVWVNVWLYLQLGTGLKELNHELFMPAIWPLFYPTTVFWLSWLATLTMVLACLIRKTNIVPAVLAIGGLILAAQATRNMPLLFLFAPLLWRHFNFQPKARIFVTANAVLASAVAVFMSWNTWQGEYFRWTGSLGTFGVHEEWASYPIGAVEFLNKSKFRGKIFCDSYDGGYLEFHLDGVTIAGDSYFSDPELTKKFFAAIKDPNVLLQLNLQVNFDAMIINIENSDVMMALLNSTDWVPAYADSHRTVFIRRQSNPGFTGDLTQFNFYHGEDLNHTSYEFGVISWMALAYQRDNRGLIIKIIADLAPGGKIPDAAFNIALKYAATHKDEDIAKMLAGFSKPQI